MDVIHRWMGTKNGRDSACAEEDCRHEQLEEADRRLREQTTRLRVLEWEAYGHRKPKGRQT